MIRIDIPFQIGPSGQKRFERKTPKMSILSVNLYTDGCVSASDFRKLFRDSIDNRSWLKRLFYFIPWIKSDVDFISIQSFVSISHGHTILLRIPLARIPLQSGLRDEYKIEYCQSGEYLVSLEWDKNPSVSKPINGTLIVLGEEC